MALDTVEEYVVDARVLLQDTLVPYRYSDAELVSCLNTTMSEVRRLRPDLFLGDGTTTLFEDDYPEFVAVNSDPVSIEKGFRPAVVYGVVAHAIMRDQEDIQDSRSMGLMKLFHGKLVTLSI